MSDAAALRKKLIRLAYEKPELQETLLPLLKTSAEGLPFDRFYLAMEGIRKKLKQAKTFNDLDLAAGHIPTYVRGGVKKGFLPKSYTSKYNRLLRNPGSKGLDGIDASRKHWLTVVDDMEKSARRMEKGKRS